MMDGLNTAGQPTRGPWAIFYAAVTAGLAPEQAATLTED